MTGPAPTEIESLVRRVVLGAAAVAADRYAEPEARRNHAGLVHALAHHVVSDEMVCAEVMRAAQSATDDHRVVRNLLEAIVGLALDQGRLVVPMRRLCEVAFGRRHDETLLVALIWLARVARDERDGDVPFEWFSAIGRVSAGRIPYFLREWVRRFSAYHPGLRALIREHELCLVAPTMTPDSVRAIHAAQPTVSGWVALARDQERAGETIGLSFGPQHAEGLATLRDARDGATDDAARERLSSWLAELEQS
jgi:hypothetical protein